MSIGIMVEDFKYIRGVNDSEYIELLKNAYEGQKYITSKAIAKLKKQPEQKIGRWINTEPNYKSGFGNNAHYCSVCKGYYTTSPSEMHYCPNCGAKMEGEFDEQ